MNILIFSWRDPKHPLAGGAEQVMHEHVKGWIKNGHKVTHFSSRFKGAASEERLDGVRILRRGNQILGVHLAAVIWYLFFKKEKYDLVIDEFHGIPFFTPFYIRAPKLAVLQEVAREVWLMNDLPKPLNIIVGTLGFILEPFIFIFYRKVFFMVGSKSAKKDLMKMGIKEDNVSVVPHGVLVEKVKIKGEKEKVKTIIFLGALAKDKGIEDAIKTFSILNKNGDFKFWVVGKGGREYLYELKKLARKSGLGSKVKFWGYVSQEKKFELLSRAYMMVNPSYREGWGLVNIEANSVRLPVVAYKSAGLVDSINDGKSGVLVKRNTPEEIAKEILKIIEDASQYNKLSEGAKKWSSRFSWKNSSKLSLKILERVAS